MKHCTYWVLAAASGAMAAQTDKAPPAFEVASVKPSARVGLMAGIHPEPGGQRYTASEVPLSLMIKLMYHLMDSQLEGGPAWVYEDLYDIEAKAERPSSTGQLHEMFKTLLAERFQLRMHTVKKELPLYALVVDKGGSRMKVSDSQDAYDVPIKPSGDGRITATRVGIAHFCWYLSQQLDRPVVDQTGLSGFYDFTLATPPRPMRFVAGPDGPPAVEDEIFTAVRAQLGLRLESRKGPVEVWVIDGVARPGEN